MPEEVCQCGLVKKDCHNTRCGLIPNFMTGCPQVGAEDITAETLAIVDDREYGRVWESGKYRTLKSR